jgi:hypothetical protein
MKYDSYTRFLKSQMYKDCIVYEMEQKPLNKLVNIFTANTVIVTAAASASNSTTTAISETNNKKQDKKRSVILPWTKGIYEIIS